MEGLLSLTIVSPNGVLFEGKVKYIHLPGVMGQFTILPLHAPLITQLCKGVITFHEIDTKKEIDIKGGFIEVKHDVVSVCVEQ